MVDTSVRFPKVLVDVGIEIDELFLDQLHHGDGHESFRDRGKREDRLIDVHRLRWQYRLVTHSLLIERVGGIDDDDGCAGNIDFLQRLGNGFSRRATRTIDNAKTDSESEQKCQPMHLF